MNGKTLIAKSRTECTAESDNEIELEDDANDAFGFTFTDKIVDNQTMFANDITNVAVVSFNEEVSIEDL